MIIEAIDKQDPKLVIEALKADPFCVGEFDTRGKTPLMHAATVLNTLACDAIVQALVGTMKAHKRDINEGDFYAGRAALHFAAECGNTTFIKALLKHAGADIHHYKRDRKDYMAHQLAEPKGYVDVLEILAGERLKGRVGSGPVTLAVLGVGPAGAGMFIRLVQGLTSPGAFKPEHLQQIKILLIDEKSMLGTGTPYSAEKNAETSVVNIPARGMSIDPSNPDDFVNYIGERFSQHTLLKDLGVPADNLLRPAFIDPKGYYPRLFYGKYVNARLNAWIAKARGAGIDVIEMPSTRVDAHTLPDGKGLIVEVLTGKDAKRQIPVTHVYYAIGHGDQEPGKLPHETASGTIVYPANRETLIKREVFAKPTNVAIMGSALSAIDVVFAVLLDPAVGTLTWQGDEPTYVPKQKGFKVTAYSRRGVWPRVRPLENVDKDPLRYCSPETYAMLSAWSKRPPTLQEGVNLLGLELDEAYGLKPGTLKPLELADPLKAYAAGVKRDPFELLMRDVQLAEEGDGTTEGKNFVLWYQVMHALYHVIDVFYRNLTPQERGEFEKTYNTPFLWAFAPMPHRSARVLKAMHDAGVLDLHRINGYPQSPDQKNLTISYYEYDGSLAKQPAVHSHMVTTTGLASDFSLRAQPLTKSMLDRGQVKMNDPRLPAKGIKEGSIFMADDGSFEMLDANGNHSPARRGVGFFLQAHYWAIGAAPSVVRYGKHAAELYLGEFAARFNKPLSKL
jgi:uncharacterized NAD(P)/FAD-binding protein YdhS